ncbi:MAG: hypothetical protein ACRDPK_00385 [Carbonactinosporaceae bacterium]
MTDHLPITALDRALPVDAETMRRLRGEACIYCGATERLAPAGHRYTIASEGGRLGWPVLACPEHEGEQ